MVSGKEEEERDNNQNRGGRLCGKCVEERYCYALAHTIKKKTLYVLVVVVNKENTLAVNLHIERRYPSFLAI